MEDDPLDVRRVISDVAELLCHEVIVDKDNRFERSNQLNYFLDRLGGKHIRYGRLHSHIALASAMFDVCARSPYPAFEDAREDGCRQRGGPKTTGEGGGEEEEEGGDDEPIHQSRADFTPLSEFTPEKWERALAKIREVREVLLRADADRVAVPRKIVDYVPGGGEEDDEEEEEGDVPYNTELAANELFGERFEDVVKGFQLQQCFSHLRPSLEEEVDRAEEEGRDTLHVQPKDLVAYEDSILRHFCEGDGVRVCLESILVKGEPSSRTRSTGLALKPAAEVREIIRSKNFDLERFQKKTEVILLNWREAALTPPKLAVLGYGRATLPPLALTGGAPGEGEDGGEAAARRPGADGEADGSSFASGTRDAAASPPPGSPDGNRGGGDPETAGRSPAPARKHGRGSPRKKAPTPSRHPEVADLRQKSEQLRKDAKDPLKECRALAEHAARNTAVGQKPPATAAVAAVGHEEESEQHRPSTPGMLKEKKSKQKLTFEDTDGEGDGDSDDEGQSATLSEVPERAKVSRPKKRPAPSGASAVGGLPKKRRFFTDEEKAAIKIGVERFGFGRWAMIKDEYKEQLKLRTPVQIKDCYRTMMKRNEV